MAETFRAPIAVVEAVREAISGDADAPELAIRLADSGKLSIDDMREIRRTGSEWGLYGGDVTRRWVEKTMSHKAIERRDAMNSYGLAPRQMALKMELEEICEVHGGFDQGIGANGAHYVAPSPFAAEGIACASCVFYEGPRGCEIVAGDIDPEGVCKLWVIPESLLTIGAPVADPVASPVVEMNAAPATETEVRSFIGTEGVEVRAIAETRAVGDGKTLTGYFAKWNSPSVDMGFTEYISPGAFTRSLQEFPDVYLLVNHDMGNLPLARTISGTLTVTEDSVGLAFSAELDTANNVRASEVYSAVSRGDAAGCSFAFSIYPGGDRWSADRSERWLDEIRIYEGSVVTEPAYPDTAVAARSVDPALAVARARAAAIQSRVAR